MYPRREISITATYVPSIHRYKFNKMKSRVTLSGTNSFSWSSATFRASGSLMLEFFGRTTLLIALKISPILSSAGDDVTGDTSTIMAFSTSCG